MSNLQIGICLRQLMRILVSNLILTRNSILDPTQNDTQFNFFPLSKLRGVKYLELERVNSTYNTRSFYSY